MTHNASTRTQVSDQRKRDVAPTHQDSQLTQAYRNTAFLLASAIASKDIYERAHINRVECICKLLCNALELSRHETDGIMLGAVVHDIGKLGVPDYLLMKSSTLTEREFEQIRSHAKIGGLMLEDVDYPWDICGMVRHHHECWDGSGYPDGICGDKISLGARIIAVAEVYDALVSERCYRESWSHERALEALVDGSGTKFDPKVIGAFLKSEKQIKMSLLQEPGCQLTDSTSGLLGKAAGTISRANLEQVSIFELVQIISRTVETDEILDILSAKLLSLANAAACSVFLRDDLSGSEYTVRKSTGVGAKWHAGHQISYHHTCDFVNPSEPDVFMQFPKAHAVKFSELKTCLSVPIQDDENIYGVIALYGGAEKEFCCDDERIVTFVSEHAATRIKHSQAFESILHSVNTDQMTGLYNAGYITNQLTNEIARASRSGENVYILCIDLDNFKYINDTYGHQVGNEVLTTVAGLLRENVREYDIVSRMGGDEFAVLLLQSTQSNAIEISKRLESMFHHYLNRRHNYAFENDEIGISVGIASYPTDGLNAKALLNSADKAMYKEKRRRKADRAA